MYNYQKEMTNTVKQFIKDQAIDVLELSQQELIDLIHEANLFDNLDWQYLPNEQAKLAVTSNWDLISYLTTNGLLDLTDVDNWIHDGNYQALDATIREALLPAIVALIMEN